MQEYFGTGMAITVSLMVVQADSVVIAHIVQLVADAGEQPPAHLHRANVYG